MFNFLIVLFNQNNKNINIKHELIIEIEII